MDFTLVETFRGWVSHHGKIVHHIGEVTPPEELSDDQAHKIERERIFFAVTESSRNAALAKGGVAVARRVRADSAPFWHMIPPLQAAPSFACSVASLSRFPDHQLPGCSHLRGRILADCLLGWGAASAQSAGHAQLQTTPSPKPERNRGNPHMTFRGRLKCTHFKILLYIPFYKANKTHTKEQLLR